MHEEHATLVSKCMLHFMAPFFRDHEGRNRCTSFDMSLWLAIPVFLDISNN